MVLCDLETSSRIRRPWPALGCSAIGGKNCIDESPMYTYIGITTYDDEAPILRFPKTSHLVSEKFENSRTTLSFHILKDKHPCSLVKKGKI